MVLGRKMMLKCTTVINFKVFAICEKCKKSMPKWLPKDQKMNQKCNKINKKVEGKSGKERKGRGEERRGEDRRGEGRIGEERRPTG